MIFILLRSTIFNGLFLIWSAILCITCLPIALLLPNYVKYIALLWSEVTLTLLRIICGVRYKVIDSSNYNKDFDRVIIASKHQSAWETIFFIKYFNCPAFILKEELIKIPVFGIYLKLLRMITIDRKNSIISIKKIIREVKKLRNHGRNIVIFPEGTRVKPLENRRYQSGIAAIHKFLPNSVIIPVALNSGLYWPKNSWLKFPGVITVHLLDKLPNDLSNNRVRDYLEEVINKHSDNLLVK